MNKFAIGLSLATLGLAGGALAADAMHPGWRGDMNATVTRAEAQTKAGQMFDRLDFNHDGKIDSADREAHKAALFDKIDSNHDGQLSKPEFLAFDPMQQHMGDHMGGPDAGAPMQGMGGQGMGRRGMRGHGMGGQAMGMMMLHQADANHDSAVSHDEFITAALARFDQTDTNHDGKVTPDERRAAFAAMRQNMHERMGEHMHGDMGGHDMPAPPPPPTPGT